MKAWLPLLVGVCLLLGTSADAANPNSFEFFVPIEAGSQARGTLAVRLPAEAVAKVRSAADMRIFDAAGREIPFFLFRYDGGKTSTEQEVAVFNMGVLDEQEQTFEFTLPGAIKEIGSLTLAIEDSSYNHQIDLYGRESADQPFRLIKKDMRIVRLLSEDEALRYEYNRLQFPPQQLRNYKAVVHLDVQHAPLALKRVRVIQTSEIPVIRESAQITVQEINTEKNPLKTFPPLHRADLKRSTLYEMTPALPLPLDTLVFSVDGKEFARRATLYGFDPKERQVGAVFASGSLFSLGGERHTAISFVPSRSAAYILELFQGDDAPVHVIDAQGMFYAMEARFIVEPNGGNPPFGLYFGNVAPFAPQYDIETRVARMNRPVFVELKSGPVARNPAFKPEERTVPATEKTPVILYGAVGLLVAILAIRLISLTKVMPKDS